MVQIFHWSVDKREKRKFRRGRRLGGGGGGWGGGVGARGGRKLVRRGGQGTSTQRERDGYDRVTKGMGTLTNRFLRTGRKLSRTKKDQYAESIKVGKHKREAEKGSRPLSSKSQAAGGRGGEIQSG